MAGNLTVEVSNDGHEFSHDRLFLSVSEGWRLHAILPSVSWLGAPSAVTISGHGFSGHGHLACMFGTESSYATVVTTTEIVCVVPSSTVARRVDVRVVGDTDQWSQGDSLGLEYLEEMYISAVVPTLVGALPGQLISVTGNHFKDRELMECVFTQETASAEEEMVSVSSVAVFKSSLALSCAIPKEFPVGSGRVFLRVGSSLYTNSLYFDIAPAPLLASLSVNSGPVDGGTLLRVFGTNFYMTSTLTCMFGFDQVTSSAEWISASAVECRTPPFHSGNVSVSVGFGVRSASLNKLRFLYIGSAKALSVHPSWGAASGGTPVVVWLKDAPISQVLTATFGECDVACKSVRTNIFRCVTPRSAQHGAVRLGFSSQSTSATSNLLFQYTQESSIAEIKPSVGKVSGGVTVDVIGQNLESRSQLYCAFSAVVVNAMYVSSTQLRCTAPSVDSAKQIEVSITQDFGSDSAVVIGARPFEYVGEHRIGSIRPSSVDPRVSATITIFGSDFTDKITLSCQFGADALSKSSASWVSQSQVTCQTPKDAKPGPSSLILLRDDLHDDNWVLSNSIEFEFKKTRHLLYLSPSCGPILGGSVTEIGFTGVPAEASIWCRFGTHESEGEFLSSTSVTCSVPAHKLASVPVQISIEDAAGVDVVENPQILYEYHLPLLLTSIVPSLGSTVSSTLVTLYGANFISDATSCRFSDSDEWQLGHVISSSKLLCLTPAHGKQATRAMVSADGFTQEDSLPFKYTERPNVRSVKPSMGTSTGGYLLTVIGRGFDPSLTWCSFGKQKSSVSVLNANTLLCRKPVLPPGEHLLTLETHSTCFIIVRGACLEVFCRRRRS